MAALTGSRDTPKMNPTPHPGVLSFLMAANAKIYAGSLVAINAAGYAVAMTAATGLTIAGIAVRDYDNTGGANGAASCEVFQCVAKLDGGTAGDAVVQANVGLAMYALDDHTVSPVATGRSQAGILVKLDPADGAPWVYCTLAVR